MENKVSTLDNKFIIIKTLGVGQTAKVKLAQDPATKDYFAVKLFKSPYEVERTQELQREICILTELNHPHVVKLKQILQTVKYVKKSGDEYYTTALLFEYVPGGELFEMVGSTGGFPEKIARAHFRTIIETIEYCHNQGITHRDLKPENLIFDENYVLKIADFGFATWLVGREGDGKLMTYAENGSFIAPEVWAKRPYNGAAIDVFACGAILFVMMNMAPPFERATDHDLYYRHIATGNIEKFWLMHENNKRSLSGQPFFGAEFRDLVNRMLTADPEARITIPDIKEHPWYNMEVESQENIKKDFDVRKAIIDQMLEKKRKRKQNSKAMTSNKSSLMSMGAYGGYGKFRSLEDLNIEQKLGSKVDFDIKRTASQHCSQIGSKPLTEIFSMLSPENLFKIVCLACQGLLSDYKASKKQYKVMGKVIKDEGRASLKVLVTRVDDDVSCIEVHRAGVAEELMKKVTGLLNEYEDTCVEVNAEEDKS